MNSIYGTPLSGLQSADSALDVTSDNIANVNTGGFEAVEPLLGALPANDPIGPPSLTVAGDPTRRVGMGARLEATARSTAQPRLVPTGRPLDLAVAGDAFLTLRRGDGTLVYARQASLDVAPDGKLTTGTGLTLSPDVRVPATVTNVQIDTRGVVTGQRADGRIQTLGRVALAAFAAPENLVEQGDGLYVPTIASGTPAAVRPGSAEVMSGYTLGSTVDLAAEMSNLVGEQRMYQANSKSLQTLDSLVNTIVSMQQR